MKEDFMRGYRPERMGRMSRNGDEESSTPLFLK
jgi:hypothetical protein